MPDYILIWQLLIASAGIGALFGGVKCWTMRTLTGQRPRLACAFGSFLFAYALGSFMALYGAISDPLCQSFTLWALARRTIEAAAVWLLVLKITGILNGNVSALVNKIKDRITRKA